jgi:hypothetical protein
MVPNQASGEALLAALGGAITVVAPAEITAWTGTGGLARLTLADARVLASPLVIAADGAQSTLRQWAGIGVMRHDYHQTGLVATISHELDHEGVAYEHFRPAGPFASLPLPGKRSSLVWTEGSAAAAGHLGRTPAELEELIEKTMGSTLGAVTLEDKLMGFPLRLQIAHSFIGPRLALIGRRRPCRAPGRRARGLILASRTSRRWPKVIVDAARLGLDHGGGGCPCPLPGPGAASTRPAWSMVTDSMVRLFSNDVAPVRALRDLGLGLVDRSRAAAKTALIRAASGELPRTARSCSAACRSSRRSWRDKALEAPPARAIARFVEAEERHALHDGKSQPRRHGDQLLAVRRERSAASWSAGTPAFPAPARIDDVAGIDRDLRHQLSGAAPLPPPAISYSVMAISVSARAFERLALRAAPAFPPRP